MPHDPPEPMLMPDERFPVKIIYSKQFGSARPLFGLHWHRHWELLEIRKGRLDLRVGREARRLSSADVAIIGGGEWHGGDMPQLPDEGPETPRLVFRTLILDPELLRSLRRDACESDFTLPLIRGSVAFSRVVSGDARLLALLESIAEELRERGPGYEPEVKGQLFRLVALLFRAHKERELGDAEVRFRMRNAERLQRALDLIETSYALPLSVDALAKAALMSRSNFCRLFAAQTGQPPLRYLNNLRLEKAEAFLAAGRGTVTEAAASAGFADLNYFSRIFRRYRGRLPSAILRTSDAAGPPSSAAGGPAATLSNPLEECLIW